VHNAPNSTRLSIWVWTDGILQEETCELRGRTDVTLEQIAEEPCSNLNISPLHKGLAVGRGQTKTLHTCVTGLEVISKIDATWNK
jgi:hypothetical protein